MSRDDGFSRADIDVGLLDDPKVRRLVRSSRDEAIVARCLIAYQSTVLASWERGERVAVEDAAPLWLTALDDLRDRLVAVELVDAAGMVPERAWDAWFGAARDRRERGRERQRRADVRRGRSKSTDGPTGSTGPSDSQTDRPSDRPAGPTSDHRGSNVGHDDAPSGDPTNGRAIVPTAGDCRICGGWVEDTETGARVGPGWIEHGAHPPEWAVSA